MLLWIVFVVAYNHQLLYSDNILNDKNVIENTENILCTHFHYSNNILHDKNVIQNTEHIMH